MRGVVENPDAHRPVVELCSVYVACDDCGHARTLRLQDLRKAAELGTYNYRQLCQKIRCGECPPRAPSFRNLTIRPTWYERAQSIA